MLDQNGQVSKSTQKLNNNTATQICNNKKSDSVLENELICPICMYLLFFCYNNVL